MFVHKSRNSVLVQSVLLGLIAVFSLTGCGPRAEFVATRAIRVDKGQGLEAIAIESMFETRSLHGQQVIFRVGLLDGQQTPIRAPSNSYRDDQGNLGASKALIAEEVTGRPGHVRVQLPMRSLGLNERHLPAYGQVQLSMPNGDVLAESTVEIPLQYADVGSNVSYPAPTSDRLAGANDSVPDGTPPPEFAVPRSPTAAARNGPPARRNPEARAPQGQPTAEPVNPEIGDSMARELVEQEGLVRANPNNVQNQLRLRMMYLALGRKEDALAFIEGTNQQSHREITTYVRRFVPGDTHPANPAPTGFESTPAQPIQQPPQPTNRVARTNNAPTPWTAPPPPTQREPITERPTMPTPRPEREPLTRRAPSPASVETALSIPEASICKEINGFNDYERFASTRFRQNDVPPLRVYLEVDNFKSTQAQTGVYRTLLAIEQKLIDGNGVEVWSAAAQDIPDFSDTPRDTFFLAVGPIRFQQTLAAGRYMLIFNVTDRTSGQSARTEVGFEVADG